MYTPKSFVPYNQPAQTSQPTQTTNSAYMPKSFVPEKRSLSGLAMNTIKSGGRLIGDTAGAIANIFNPDMEKNTVVNLGKLAVGTAQYLDPTQALGTQYEPVAKAVGNFYKNRYGSLKKASQSAYDDPFGVVADIAGVATGAGGLIKGGVSVAGKAGLVSKTGRAAKVANMLVDAGNAIDPLVVGGRSAVKGTKLFGNRVGAKLAETTTDLSERLPTRGLGNPAVQAKAAGKAGQSTAQFMRKYNWWDRSSSTIEDITKQIIDEYNNKALNSNTTTPTIDLVAAIDEKMNSLKNGVNGVVSDSDIQALAELQRRKDQLLKVIGATDKQTPEISRTRDLALYRKKVLDPDIPKSTFNLDANASGKAAGAKALRDILRKTINSTDPDLERLGLDYGQGKALTKVAAGAESRAANRQLFNFTKLGSAGLGGLMAGIPGMVGGFAVEQIVNSPQFLKVASTTLKNLSERLPEVKPIIKNNKQALYKEIVKIAVQEGSSDPAALAKSLAERYMLEPQYKQIIDDLGREVSNRLDGRIATAPLKGTKRATQKIVRDAQAEKVPESASNIRDISRNTIVVPDYRQAESAANTLALKNDRIVYDPTRKNYFRNPTPAGYRGINVNLKTPVGQSEIQINIPEMLVAKMPPEDAIRMVGEKQFKKIIAQGIEPGAGHKLYEQQRQIMEIAQGELEKRMKNPSKYTEDNGLLYTTDEYKKIRELNLESNDLYNRAMALHKKNRSGILPTAQAYGFTRYNTKTSLFNTGRAGRMNRTE